MALQSDCQLTASFVPAGDQSYTNWSDAWFGKSADPHADADQDGFLNAVEYAFALDPLTVDSQKRLLAAFSQDHTLGLRLTRLKNATDAKLQFEVSANLLEWRLAEFGKDYILISTTDHSDGSETIVLEFTDRAGVYFVRLRLSMPV